MTENGNARHSPCLVKMANILAELHDSERRVAQLINATPPRSSTAPSPSSPRDRAPAKPQSCDCANDWDTKAPGLKIRLAQKNKVFDSHIRALDDSVKVLDDDAFVRAVQTLASARCVEFYGTGGSGAIALDAHHKFLKIGIKGFASPDSTLQAMSASLLGAGDVVVGISHSGGNKDVIEALALARSAGATVIAITNYGQSPIRRVSDILLFTASKETAFKSDAVASRIAELAIIDALCAAVAFSRYEQSFGTLKKTRGVRYPSVIGHEFAGIIEEVGRDAKAFRRGARVSVAPVMACHACRYVVIEP